MAPRRIVATNLSMGAVSKAVVKIATTIVRGEYCRRLMAWGLGVATAPNDPHVVDGDPDQSREADNGLAGSDTRIDFAVGIEAESVDLDALLTEMRRARPLADHVGRVVV